MKTQIASIILASLATAQAAITSYAFPLVETPGYVYGYLVDSSELHVLELEVGCPQTISDIKASEPYLQGMGKNNIHLIFNNHIEADKVAISFTSKNPPIEGTAKLLGDGKPQTFSVQVPSCNIPEPSTLILSMLGSLLLFRRERD